MNITELPNGLMELAIKRHKEEQDKERFFSNTHVRDAFDWSETKEGFDFWSGVNKGNFSVYKEKYSDHEWVEYYPGEYETIIDRSTHNISVVKIDTAYSIGTKLYEDVDISSLTITPAVLANGYYAGEGVKQDIKEAWVKGYEYACRNKNLSDIMYVPNDGLPKNPPEVVYVSKGTTLTEDANLTGGSGEVLGIKESQNKLSYQEIDFNFIDLMASSMTKNKDKYTPFNWHKPINKLDMVDAILRHTRKVKQPIEGDVETAEEHLVNIACNAMMLWYQYKYNK